MKLPRRLRSLVQKKQSLRTTFKVAVLLVLANVPSPSRAAVFSYVGATGTTTTPTTGNFSGVGFSPTLGTPSASNSTFADTLSFAGGTAYTATDDFTVQILANALSFSNTAAITLARGGTGTSNSISLGGTAPSITLNNTALVTDALDLVLAANTTVTGTGTGGLNISGVVSGTGFGLTNNLTGGGVLTLSGNNTYTGTTTIGAGASLQISATATETYGATGAVTNNGTLFLSPSAGNLTYGAAIGGSGGLTKLGAGTAILSATSGYTGGTSVSAGSLTFNGSGSAGTGGISVTGGSVSVGTVTALTTTNAVTLATGTTLFLAATGTPITYPAFQINANGSSSLNMNGADVQVSNLGSAIVLNNTGTTAGGQTFTISETKASDTLNLTGLISGTGNLTIAPAGNGNPFVVTINKAESFTGSVFVTQSALNDNPTFRLLTGGSLPATTQLTLTASANASRTATFDLNGQAQTFSALLSAGTVASDRVTGTAAGSALTINNAATDNFAGVISGVTSLSKTASGTLIIGGANTYTGGTTIAGGPIQMNGATSTLGSVNNTLTINTGGALDLNGTNQGAGILTGSSVAGNAVYNSVNGSTSTLTVGNNNATGGTFAGIIANTNSGGTGLVALTKTGTGTQTLTGANTYSGLTTINGGTLAVNGVGALGGANYGGLTFNGGTLQYTTGATGNGPLDITANSGGTAKPVTLTGAGTVDTNGNTVTFANALTGAGALAKAGTGTLTLNGTNTYSGLTTVSGGILAGVGANAFGSTSGISIAGAGTLSLRGDASTAFVKNSDSTPYSVTTTATAATINVDEATVAGTAAKTMTIGNFTVGSAAATAQTVFTGANNTSLQLGAATDVTAVSGTVQLTNNIASTGTLTIPSFADLRTGTPTLKFDGSGSTIVTGAISQTGTDSLLYSGTGKLTLQGTNAYSGGTTISGGTLNINSDAALGTVPGTPTTNLTFTATSTLQSTSDVTLDTNRNVTLAGTDKFDTNGNNLTINGVISGAGTLQKVGAGTLILSGNNSFTGGVSFATATSGAIRLTSDNALGGGSKTLDLATAQNTGSGSTLELTNNINVPSNISLTLGGRTVGTAYTALRNVSGNNSFAGTLKINNSGGGYFIDLAGGTLTLSGTLSNTVVGAARGFTFLNSGNAIISGTIQDGSGTAPTSLITSGTGTVTLSNANTYTGGTTVSGGTLALTDGGAAGTGNITDTATVAFTNTGALSVGNLISGAGTVKQTGGGTTTLTGANTYSGGTTVSAGTLALGNGGTFGTGGVTDSAAVAFLNTGALSVGNVISGTGTLTQAGTGTTALTAANTYNGNTNVNAGTLIIAGNQTGNGQLVVNNAGVLQFGNGLSTSGSADNSGTIFVNDTGTVNVNETTGGTVANQVASNPGAVTTLSGTNLSGTTNTFTATEFSNNGSFAVFSSNAGAVLAFSGNSPGAIDLKGTDLTVNGAGNTLITSAGSGIYSSTGTSNVIKNGTGTLIYQGNQGYTGETDINVAAVRADVAQTNGGTYFVGNGGTTATPASLLLGGGATGLTGSVTFDRAVTVNPGDGTSRTVGGTNTSGTNTFSSNIALGGVSPENRSVNLTAATGGTVSYTGGISGAGQNVTVIGGGITSLDAATTFSGNTVVNTGTLQANVADSLASTTAIAVNNGGTLLLSGSGNLNRVNNGAGITLAGGALAVSGTASEGTGASVNGGVATGGASVAGLGALTLTANSSLDFGGAGANTLTFTDFTANGFVLNITNYTNTTSDGISISGVDNTDDRLIFTTDQSGNLANFSFGGLGATEINLLDGGFEIVPVPEPATWIGGAFLTMLIAWEIRRRFRSVRI